MKLSKITFIGVFIFLCFSNFSTIPNGIQDKTEVYFSNKQSIEDLTKIKTELKSKGISLNYDYLKFSTEGKLTAIEYHVKTDKMAGADKTDDISKEIGFIINNNLNAKYGIIVGTKEGIENRLKKLEAQE